MSAARQTPPAESGPIRVLVVDDSAFMRKAIVRMLGAATDIEVIGTAKSGEEAIDLVRRLEPDVVTLDVVLPGADGITVLEHIMAKTPVPVLMLSALTTRDAETTFMALERGAVDVVAKPSGLTHMDMPLIAGELIGKIRTAASVDTTTLGTRERADGSAVAEAAGAEPIDSSGQVDALVIGASTGGPPALTMLASNLPAGFPVPVLLVQHMPAGFTTAFSQRLDRLCDLRVVEASDGDLFTPGTIYIARSGKHVTLKRRGQRVVLQLGLSPAGLTHVPSIDVAMRSAAEVYGERAMGVLLTGMGEDGARGLLAMREAGGYTVAESEESAVIWGMPRAAIEMQAAVAVAALPEIPSIISRRCRRRES